MKASEAAVNVRMSNNPGSVESIDLAPLLDDVSSFLRRFIAFTSDAQPSVLSLWVAHTWAIAASRFTPYVMLHSPEKQCAKSRLIECLCLIVPRPLPVISPTAATLFRVIDRDQPTLFIDETDTCFRKGRTAANEPLRAVLNAGYERGRTVPRCTGRHGVVYQEVFCPKLLAGIGTELSDTVKDRSIPIQLVRRRPDELVERFRKVLAETVAAPLHKALKRWADSELTIEKLRLATPPIPSEFSDRRADILEPLLAIADLAGDSWPERARRGLSELFSAQPEEQTVGVMVLSAIRDVFVETGRDRLPSETIIKKLVAREDDAPWIEWWEPAVRRGNTRGPAAKLVRILEPFKINPKTIRLSNGRIVRGYYRESFDDAWGRYCPAKAAE